MTTLKIKHWLCVGLAVALAGCASQKNINGSLSSIDKDVNTKHPANSRWHSLGVSPNGNVLHEIDGLSIKAQGNNRFTFRDRKTIFNQQKANYLNTPPYKRAINSWVINCSDNTIRLLGVSLFDADGREISKYAYNDNQIKSAPVVKDTASYQQMEFICGSR